MAKNKHAQALSKLGARKGGLARAVSMTPEERSEQARKAGKIGARVRWEKRTRP